MDNNELIKLTTNEEGKQLVSARELHEFLEVNTRFDIWMTRMIEYGFEENKDFNVFKFEQVQTEGKRQVKRDLIDYAITIEMAKELSMIQRTDKGKQARQYFIECEKKLRESNNKPQLTLEQELVWKLYVGGIDAVTAHNKLLDLKTKELKETIEEQGNKIEEQQETIEVKEEEIKQLSPLAETLIKRFEKGENITFTDVTKTFGLKRGQASKWAINNGYIYKNKKDVCNKGDEYFQRYVINGFKNICVTPQGVQLIEQHLDEIKLL